MATFVQAEEGNFNNGLLPLNELLLEIQIQKLIHEYLFASNAGEMCMSLPVESSKRKQTSTAQDAPSIELTEAFHDDCKQSPYDPRRKSESQASPALHSVMCIEDCGINGTEDTSALLLAANRSHEAGLASLSVESGVKVMNGTAHLSRVGTIPRKGSAQVLVGMLTRVKTETKSSFKKPPRPPKLPKSELNLSITRCCSDNGTYPQSVSTTERKRKATANVSTSILAVLFTLCFAIIMIAQGFGSQNSQDFGAYGDDASSPPTRMQMRASSEKPADDSNLTGLVKRQASMEVPTEREAASESVLAPYEVRKVPTQPSSRYEALRT